MKSSISPRALPHKIFSIVMILLTTMRLFLFDVNDTMQEVPNNLTLYTCIVLYQINIYEGSNRHNRLMT